VCVFRQLERDALERFFRLHHAQGDVEAAQVFDQRSELGAAADGRAEPFDVVRRELDVVGSRDVENGLEPERAVEMNV
jgi:hypothetical protein